MARKKKISVITTFYNAETFIQNAIASVMQQQGSDFTIEYVIVDDKSQDNSRKIVEQMIAEYDAAYKDDALMRENACDKEFKLIEPDENLGCGGARKFGIEHATGDYFMFLDADDYYIRTDFVQRAYDTITKTNADIVEFGMVFNHPNGQQQMSCVQQQMIVENPMQAEILLFKDNAIKFNVWTKIYTRAIVESYEYSDERYFEDVRTIPVWVANAKRIVIMPTCEINYRAASGSIIRDDIVSTRLGTITAIAELFERFKENRDVLKAMYGRAMVDLEALLHNHSSNNKGFNEMSQLNTKMLKYIFPNTYKDLTYNVEDDPEASPHRPEYD